MSQTMDFRAGNVLPAAMRELRRGDADGALALLDQANAPLPGRDASWHAVRGMALLARESWAAARDSLVDAMACGDDTAVTALNLALARGRLGEREAAEAAILSLERIYPHWEEPPFRLAEMLRADGRVEEAMAAYERALLLAPSWVEALLRLATLYLAQGSALQASSLLVRCCGVDPSNWEAWDALGMSCSTLDDHEAAWSAFRRARHLNPVSIPIAARLAHAACALGQADVELARFEADSAENPLDTVALAGRAALLLHLGRDQDAAELLEAAVAIAPDDRPLAGFRADLLARGRAPGEALAAMRHALALDTENPAWRANLVMACSRSHRYPEALALLQAMPEDQSNQVALQCHRALASVCTGRQDDAVAAATHATKLAPMQHAAWRMLANTLVYSAGVTGQALGVVLARAAETAPRPAGTSAAPMVRRAGAGRLRIGLLSATLKTHPVGWLTLAGFEHLDPGRFELVCVAQRETNDAMQRRFRAVASEWHPLADQNGGDMAAAVRALDIDVIIDLGGYGDRGMLELCAQRLAPVQVKWVGMQTHTTAMPEMDWFITDRWETPPEHAHLYTERLLVMPDGYVCYTPPVQAPHVTELPALARGVVTFGCFNNLAKVTPHVVMTWSEILSRVPGSRLVLKTHQLAHKDVAARLFEQFSLHGIDGDRLEFRGASGHRELLAEYGDIDMVLDPFPYSGGLTTCEAMWMGVPVLSCPGEIFASRHSASHLNNVGLHDWVVPDLASYVTEAVRRAGDLPQLAALRRGLRSRVGNSPLCDAPRFGRHLGDALSRAWRDT